MGTLRASSILAAFFTFTVPLMPVQAAFVRLSPKTARRFPHWYHKNVCRILGVRVRIEGEVAQGVPVLLVSNHTSWLDIPVLSAVAPVSFVAKKEVGSWPFVSALARLQRTVFVDRTRRRQDLRLPDERL
jgi:1-acyl-sn-glycerol-3-phosphate acyltransferase